MARAAATYFVLGKADDENFAKAEHLAETLMSALPSGVMPTSSTTLPTCPAGLTRGVSVAVTCHIVPTLPEAWPALCKTTCARYVRPRCDALHPLPPRCRVRVHWRAGWARLALAAACHQSPPLAASLCASIRAASKPPALRPRRLGCEEAHPLVWTGTGKFVGDAQHVEKRRVQRAASALVPRRAPPAAWDARLRAWADPCTLEARLSRPDPSDS